MATHFQKMRTDALANKIVAAAAEQAEAKQEAFWLSWRTYRNIGVMWKSATPVTCTPR